MWTSPSLTLVLGVALIGAGVSSSDAAFAKQALQSGSHEIAQAALQADSTDARVRAFAGRMTTDHKTADQQLVAIADAKGLDTSASQSQPGITATTPAPNGVAGAPVSGGKVLSPVDYFREEIRAHRTAIALFEREAASGTDPQLRAFARSTLPALEHHLQLAQQDLAAEQKGR